MLRDLFTQFVWKVDSIAQKRVYITSFMLLVLLATSTLFYQHANHFGDVDYHIPATILAQSHDYDLEGYGLSFVKSDELGALSFSHYQSAIGVQGFLYAWLYNVLELESIKPLYRLTAFFSALCLLICAVLLGKIFGKAFGIIFFLSLFTSSWVANFSGSLYFSFGFWFLPAIVAYNLYIYLVNSLGGGGKEGLDFTKETPQNSHNHSANPRILKKHQASPSLQDTAQAVAKQSTTPHKHSKPISTTILTLLCLVFTLTIALRASMSYEFITSIILFSLSPFIVSFVYELLTDSKAPFLSLSVKRAFNYGLGLFILACVGFGLTFMLHTYIRGGGDLWAGLIDIYRNDFLRRMVGGSAKDFDPVYAASLNANALEVIRIYLSKPLMLLLLGVSIFACFKESSKAYRAFYIALITGFALSALSWFVLGKSHSYIHRHFCFVLWYLGFWASLLYAPIYYLYRRFCHSTC